MSSDPRQLGGGALASLLIKYITASIKAVIGWWTLNHSHRSNSNHHNDTSPCLLTFLHNVLWRQEAVINPAGISENLDCFRDVSNFWSNYYNGCLNILFKVYNGTGKTNTFLPKKWDLFTTKAEIINFLPSNLTDIKVTIA